LIGYFSVDEVVTSQLVSFVQFQTTVLHAVHKAIAADLDARNLMLEYEEIAKPLPELVKCLSRSEEYPTVLTVLSHVLAAKPYSADVERCISANNLMKISLNSRLNMNTETRYLFIIPQSSAKCSLESKTCSAVVVNAEISTYKRPEKRQSAKALPKCFPGGAWQ